MKEKVQKFAPFVVIGIIVIFAAVVLWQAKSVDNTLSASGTIEALEVQVAPQVSGQVLEILVAEGDEVEAGDVLARIDSSMLETQLAGAQAALAAAQASYDLLVSGGGEAQHTAALAAAEIDVITAQQAVDDLIDYADLMLAQAQATAASAAIAAEDAQDAFDRLSSSASDNQVALAQANLDAANEALQLADAEVANLEDGPDPDTLAIAENRLTAAQAKYDLIADGPDATQLEAAQAQVDGAAAAVATLELQLAHTEITAPISGTVMYISVEVGEMGMAGIPVVGLAQLGDLTLTVYLPEDRYGVVQVNDEVTVQVDSYPDVTFTAKVERIADQAEFTPRNVQTAEGRRTTVYAIELSLQDPDGNLKPGMPADVQFDE